MDPEAIDVLLRLADIQEAMLGAIAGMNTRITILYFVALGLIVVGWVRRG